MAARETILYVSDAPVPDALRRALHAGWDLTRYRRDEPLDVQLSAVKLAVMYPNGQSNDPRTVSALLSALEHTPAVAILMLDEHARDGWELASARKGQFVCIPRSAGSETILAQLTAAAALQPAIANLQADLASVRSIATTSAGVMEEVDEEMRLAARLQRDFLPRRLPEVGPVRFSVLYRPATWVSGDIYDIVRLDERHVGFYVADAVGHGMPAALLTMFIKHALQTKRIVGNTYQIIPPEVSLSELNADICQQNLSSCQFCTACYGVLDAGSLRLTYCRAGHPPAILFRAGGQVEHLEAPGSLLGIFPEEAFQSCQVELGRGDRLVAFTDGAEEALRLSAGKANADLAELIEPLADAPRDEMLLQLTQWIDAGKTGPTADDDITVMVMDIEK